MSQVITFGNTLLAGTGKRGILMPMADGSGYTRMNAGGFNIPNRSGVSYAFNEYLRECMSEASDLNRRVSEGQVYCELGHPDQFFVERVNGVLVRTKITEVFQWITRLRTIVMANVCAHIRKIHWTMTGGEKDPIYNEVELIPFGPFKEWTEDALKNPDINFALSLRSVTMPQEMGDLVRMVEYLSTYDVVIEQGVKRACKFLTAGLESLLEQRMSVPFAEVNTTVDELIHVCEQGVKDVTFLTAYEGTESINRVNDMINVLKKMHHKKPIQLVRSNALHLFG